MDKKLNNEEIEKGVFVINQQESSLRFYLENSTIKESIVIFLS